MRTRVMRIGIMRKRAIGGPEFPQCELPSHVRRAAFVVGSSRFRLQACSGSGLTCGPAPRGRRPSANGLFHFHGVDGDAVRHLDQFVSQPLEPVALVQRNSRQGGHKR